MRRGETSDLSLRGSSQMDSRAPETTGGLMTFEGAAVFQDSDEKRCINRLIKMKLIPWKAEFSLHYAVKTP